MIMGMTREDLRDLVALWCKVAWADGVVHESERHQLRAILAKVGEGAVSVAELELWLDQGPPEVQRRLPVEARKLFLDEAVRVVSADQDVAPEEVETIRASIDRYFCAIEDMLVG